MTFGIVLAVSVCGVTNFLGNLSMQPIISYWEAAIVTGIAAMGFGMIFNVPRRSLPIVALLGVLGMCLRNFIALICTKDSYLVLWRAQRSFHCWLCVSYMQREVLTTS